jgi:hypothetical protein
MPSVGYIAYIDEAGDDGLTRVKPLDPNGASEWMVLSAVLIRSDREASVLAWVKEIITKIEQHQIRHLHFRELRDAKRIAVVNHIAGLPVRIFTVASNKRNMRGYANHSAALAKINVTAWFYCWLSRVLIERVTDYCNRKSIRDHGEIKSIRFEFSARGGVRIDDVARYLKYLKNQDEIGLLYNDFWVPAWPVIDFDEIYSHPAKARAGLQLADCTASAFFQALEMSNEGNVKPDYAKLLIPRVARSKKERICDFGLKIWPGHARDLVQPQQQEILDFYGRV